MKSAVIPRHINETCEQFGQFFAIVMAEYPNVQELAESVSEGPWRATRYHLISPHGVFVAHLPAEDRSDLADVGLAHPVVLEVHVVGAHVVV